MTVTVVKRNGVHHALMSEPSCAYCSGATGEMTARSMLGPWSGAWYDPNGVHRSGRPEPRWRARIVNADNCGGRPLATFPLAGGYYFLSDRWNDRAPTNPSPTSSSDRCRSTPTATRTQAAASPTAPTAAGRSPRNPCGT